MAETVDVAMTTPASYGDKPLPKRNGARGMLPSTWIGRTLRIEYVDVWGAGRETSGILLDWYPFGPTFNIRGSRTTLSWEKLGLLELVEG